jgi:MraZ protein
MFIGRYYHTLETKGRLSIPKDYRSQLKSGAVLTKGLDGCLFLFPSSSWNKLVAKLDSLPLTNAAGRNFVRLLVQSSAKLSLDSLGRTLIPEYLRLETKLKKHVVVAGALSRVEIWDRVGYHKHLDEIEKQLANSPELEALQI